MRLLVKGTTQDVGPSLSFVEEMLYAAPVVSSRREEYAD